MARTSTCPHVSDASQPRSAGSDSSSCTTLLTKQLCAVSEFRSPGTIGPDVDVRASPSNFASAAASACERGLLISELLRAQNWCKMAKTSLTG